MKQLLMVLSMCFSLSAIAQINQVTKIKGNVDITASSENATAIATGENNVAKNRIGVVKSDVNSNIKITASVKNVTTAVSGRNKKACTNIGVVLDKADSCN
jgi:hypothetical protein